MTSPQCSLEQKMIEGIATHLSDDDASSTTRANGVESILISRSDFADINGGRPSPATHNIEYVIPNNGEINLSDAQYQAQDINTYIGKLVSQVSLDVVNFLHLDAEKGDISILDTALPSILRKDEEQVRGRALRIASIGEGDFEKGTSNITINRLSTPFRKVIVVVGCHSILHDLVKMIRSSHPSVWHDITFDSVTYNESSASLMKTKDTFYDEHELDAILYAGASLSITCSPGKDCKNCMIKGASHSSTTIRYRITPTHIFQLCDSLSCLDKFYIVRKLPTKSSEEILFHLKSETLLLQNC